MSPVEVATLSSFTPVGEQPVVLFRDGDDRVAKRQRHLWQRQEYDPDEQELQRRENKATGVTAKAPAP
jgi:hypothetical protein